MRWQHPIVLFVGLCGAGWGFLYQLFPLLEENPLLDLVAPARFFTNGIRNLVLRRISLCGGP